MAPNHVLAVRRKLQGFADRGVFRGFLETPGRGENAEFQFVWLEERPFYLRVNVKSGRLEFRDIVPNVELNSDLHREVRAYIRGRHATELPAHRRIDLGRAEAFCTNRGGNLSIGLKVKRNQYAYGTTKIVNLVNEVFVLLHTEFFEYMVENFGASEE